MINTKTMYTKDLKEIAKIAEKIKYNKEHPKFNMQHNSYSDYNNLILLDKKLKELGYLTTKGERYPKNGLEIGTQSFLQAIYDSIDRSGVDSIAKTATALEMLGIKKIKFCPFDINENMSLKSGIHIVGMMHVPVSYREKLYTDGSFVYKNVPTTNDYYINDLIVNKYFLKITTNPYFHINKVNTNDSFAVIKQFDIVDDLPSIEEVISSKHPMVKTVFRDPRPWDSNYPVTEVFDKFDQNEEFQEKYKVLMK